MFRDIDRTLIERKSRMPQIQGVKGEAVVGYCELLTTLKMGYHPAKSGKGKQNEDPKGFMVYQ